MIDITKYLEKSIQFNINGEVIDVLEPNVKLRKQVIKLYNGTEEKDYLDINSKLTQIFLNNNKNNRIFTVEEVEAFPERVHVLIINEINKMLNQTEQDPN